METLLKTKLIALVLMGTLASFQNESKAQAYGELKANHIKAGFHTNGSFFQSKDFDKGNFIAPYQDGTLDVAAIFAGGLWMGGTDQNGTLKVAYRTYASKEQTYYPGPIINNEFDYDFDFDRVWKVTQEDIVYHVKNYYEDNEYEIPQSVLEWPGEGNELYEFTRTSNETFAPFVDFNGDGIYNPEKGDFPSIGHDIDGVFADELVYYVYNFQQPNGGNLGIDVHTLWYNFYCDESPELNNAIFSRHRFVSRDWDPLFNFKVGFWQDADLGCYTDDYVGCDTTLNMFYTYNADELDGDIQGECQGVVNTYGDRPPVQGTAFLDQEMESFIAYYNAGNDPLTAAVTDPRTKQEVYHYLNGRFKDGTVISPEGYGYNLENMDTVRYAFYDDPNDTLGWSMYADQLANFDIRTVANTGIDLVAPGQMWQMNMVHFITQDQELDHVGNVQKAKDDLKTLKKLYDMGFEGTCAELMNRLSPVADEAPLSIDIYPNPATSTLFINQDQLNVQYTIMNTLGQCIQKGTLYTKQQEIHIEAPSGLYFVTIYDPTGAITHNERIMIE